eukprot:gb/GECH01001516.1/.p1 GENE.gb/GECH01001516.1/~~gb/GECH01001516.1/.p1  ORF type:complete len:613 (+),score=109.86 gb/GECH01001516.1/:1-1839(+)
MSLLAATSVGPSVHVLNLNKENFNEKLSFAHTEASINVIRWNHNNQVVVSGGSDGIITLNHSNGSILGRLHGDNIGDGVCGLSFSSGSRYLCEGGGSGVVRVWDLKKKEAIKTLRGHKGPVTGGVVFSAHEEHVASGSASGEVLVHQVVSRRIAARLQPPDMSAVPDDKTTSASSNPTAVVDVKYSPFHPTLLAAAHDTGSIHLYDTQNSTCHLSFHEHTAPASSLCFSSVHGSLLVSAGLDRRMNFYDIRRGSVVNTMEVPGPATSIDFAPDGHTLLAGTAQGKVLLYDLRASTSSPVVSSWQCPGQRRPITCIQFQRGSSGNTSEPRTSHKTMPTSSNNDDHSSSSSFSLEKSPNPKFDSSRPHQPPQQKQPQQEKQSVNSTEIDHRNHEQTKSNIVQSTSSALKPSSSTSTAAGTLSSNTRNVSELPPSTKIQKTKPAPPSPSPPPSPSVSGPVAMDIEERPPSSSQLNPSITSTHLEDTQKKSDHSINNTQNIKTISRTSSSSRSGNIRHTNEIGEEESRSYDRSEGKLTTNGEIERVIEDQVQTAVDHLRQDLHRDIHNLHVDMISMFHSQSSELHNLVNDLASRFEPLVQEVKELREENRRLRHMH